MRSREANDEAVQPQATQVIRHAAGGDRRAARAQEQHELRFELRVRKPAGEQAKEDERAEECLYARFAEAERRGALAVHDGRLMELLKHRVAHGAIMTEAFHLEETPVGGEADAAQGREIVRVSRRPMLKSRVLLMVVSVRSVRPSL